MLHVTLNAIRTVQPCEDGWRDLLDGLGKIRADDEPLALVTILDSNGLGDALFCLRALTDEMDRYVRDLVCDLAETALPYVPRGEERPRRAIEAARRYARSEATLAELTLASVAAEEAAWSAAREVTRRPASDAPMALAWAAASDAALAAAHAAGSDPIGVVALDAASKAACACANGVASAIENAAAMSAAYDAWAIAWVAQAVLFRRRLSELERLPSKI